MVAGFWVWWKKKGKENSSLFKMALGTIIMGLGFVFMMFASKEAGAEPFGKAAMVWIILAYLFHTIGELCASPVSLSFITKLAPLKYASIMMGLYFAATGFGNKLAGSIGEASQLEQYEGELIASVETMNDVTGKVDYSYVLDGEEVEINDFPINHDLNIGFKTNVFVSESDGVVFETHEDSKEVTQIMNFDTENQELLKAELVNFGATRENPMHAKLLFEKDGEKIKLIENKGDGQDYSVSFVMDETQNKQEYKIFMWIVIYTVAFGLLLMLFLKKLKRLTHGAEDNEGTMHEENEGFELADKE
jgi:POT family proton-dependent oligopeptide transporter